MLKQLQQAVSAGQLRALDYHFAALIARLAPGAEPAALLAAALVSQRAGEGDVCLSLADFAAQPLFATGEAGAIAAPALDDWLVALANCAAVGQPGEPDQPIDRPLILDGGRLYLARYWQQEDALARALLARVAAPVAVDEALLAQGLERLFTNQSAEVDWQKVAAAVAVLHRFAVISGGPGTGKTRTVASLLALLAEQPDGPRRIALAAPTGKAAARLTEAIRREKARLPIDEAQRARIPEEAQTLHRLLGARPDGSYRHGPSREGGRPLLVDALVVDEASMVDLTLMSRLLSALPADARLILLGDRDQLAAVEAGNVLGDICAGAGQGVSAALAAKLAALGAGDVQAVEQTSPLADCVTLLQKSYRFDSERGIGALASAIKAGDGEAALAVLRAGHAELDFASPSVAELPSKLAGVARRGYADYLRAQTPAEALAAFNQFRILAALREGPWGVAAINRQVERALSEAGMIRPQGRLHYPGRPVMITRNDYSLRLFNGDIGLMLRDPQSGELRAWFAMPDGELRVVSPARLPAHETVFAMTVHKSQGSEFDELVLVLPEEGGALLSRELLYTGVTRARLRVGLWMAGSGLFSVCKSVMVRGSGLKARLGF